MSVTFRSACTMTNCHLATGPVTGLAVALMTFDSGRPNAHRGHGSSYLFESKTDREPLVSSRCRPSETI